MKAVSTKQNAKMQQHFSHTVQTECWKIRKTGKFKIKIMSNETILGQIITGT